MKIAIDVSQIVYGTGVSLYTKNLVSGLLKYDRENEYLLFAGALRRKGEVLKVFPQAKIFPIPPVLGDFVWNWVHKFPIDKLIGRVDILHTSDWTEPPSLARKVTTVHDLYPFLFPKLVHPRIREAHKRKISWVLKESERIIVPSQSTRSDLVDLGAKSSIIRVIPEAPAFSKASQEAVSLVKKKYRLNGDYVISIGITPLKNTQSIINAFHLSKSGKNIKLVLVGRDTGVGVSQERDVRILGHVPHEDIGPLLSGSSALIAASLYEGYGIPILDGFACGVPVVTSNISSMPEVAGDAAVLVDPTSIESISEGIQKALSAPKTYISKGAKRVEGFSWEKTAKMTLDVYKELAPL